MCENSEYVQFLRLKTIRVSAGFNPTVCSCVLCPLPAEVDQVDEGSEIFYLIGQQMSCGVGGGQDMGRIRVQILTDKEASVM